MKVLLVEAPDIFLAGQGATRHVLPLGLACLAAAVRQAGHRVRLLLPDTVADAGGDPWGRIQAALADEAPDVVGITLPSVHLAAAARLAALARSALPRASIVLGGPHPTLDPLGSLAAVPQADFAVAGEGEAALVGLLARQRGADHALPAGVTARGVRASPPASIDLDAWPAPLKDPGALVWAPQGAPSLWSGLITQRGCPYACLYCASAALCGRRARARAIPSVLAEVRALVRQHDPAHLFFHDPVFTLDPARTLALLDALVDAALARPFTCQTRTEHLSAEVVAALARARCGQVLLGIESGDPDTLARIGKDPDMGRVRAAIERLRAAGIRAAGFFLLGLPWETRAHLARTVDVALDLGLDALHLFVAAPLPGSGLAALAPHVALPEGHDFRAPGLHLTGLPDADFRALVQDARARFDAYNRAQR